MPDSSPQLERSRWKALVRRGDQLALAIVLGVSLLAMATTWVIRGGLSGDLIEIDRAGPRTAKFQVDINQAGPAELSQLPEIGEKLADRIVESRATHGPFADHDDLRRVRGIGPRTLEKIRPYLLPMPSGEAVAGN